MSVKSKAIVGMVLLLLPVLGFVLRRGAADEAEPPQTASQKAAAIKSLLKERCDVLAKVVEVMTTNYKQGAVDFSTLAQAEREALQAGAELAENPKDRIAVLRRMFEWAKANERFVKAKVDAGYRATEVDLLQATAVRIEVQVELLREELKTHR